MGKVILGETKWETFFFFFLDVISLSPFPFPSPDACQEMCVNCKEEQGSC